MFIKVRYGDDKSLLCNPQCCVSNLLDSIAKRSGFKNSGKILDLSDDTGLVLRLADRAEDYAEFYLRNYSTYILVEKLDELSSDQDGDTSVTNTPRSCLYLPLLDKSLLPKLQLRVAMDTASMTRPHRTSRSPRPGSRNSVNKSLNNKKQKRQKAKTLKEK